jgi:hypothetical protein
MRQLKKISGALAVAIIASSCSSLIREDRSGCPATLFFEFLDSQGIGPAELMYLEASPVLGGSGRVTDTTTVGAMADKSYSLQVRRSDAVSIYGMACFGNSRIVRESGWVVDLQQDGDKLYRFSAKASGMDESAVIPVEMTKEHCSIHVTFIDFDRVQNQGRFPFRVVVSANTCGIDLHDGVPVTGPFRYSPPEQLSGEFQFTVPRQADQSLTLELWEPEADESTGKPLDSILLWNLLKQVEGFSWDLKNLPDISVKIDYIRSEVTLSISDWQNETSINYAI